MERLLLLDAKNYDEDMDEFVRVAVRGIIFIGDRLLLIEDNKGEVKLPGVDISRKSEGTSRAITRAGYSTRSADCISARCPLSVEKCNSANRKSNMVCVLHFTPLMKR